MKREICIRVMFFASTADVVGKRTIEVLVPEGSKSKELFDKLIAEFPELSDKKLLFAVNQEYANGNEVLRDGDEVAIFTPVSGG
ncbi:MAG: MoaD/ThiS family protein [Acidobacteria bacterium]|nr:MAG: MoaD/ThiS family protein [Acidobacteriota bacterium]GIU81166.1 MAG: molybdopterin synthase sulfur carrier subunit [Pyrinomonadaceae bacterium]